MSRNRNAGADRRGRPRTAKKSASGLSGLRWVPVPLAMLAAALGWLVLGGAVGQHAATAAAKAEQGFDAGGLQLKVDTMLWMSNDMSGQGPVKNKNPNGFKMPTSMMPGMQVAGNNRLRVEFSVSNVSRANQAYYVRAFRVVTPNGKSYGPNNNDGSTQPTKAILRPGFGTIFDLYYDVPVGASKGLNIEWTHGGTTVTFPVDTNGTLPAPHIH
jgi:hypothetical protein